ncbi:cysteine dioxygenase [Mycolicibacterium palauense]|uniref:cysteine dioxygenase n=1 Tax=Mycolicibacterium palauense TaxID=2034511 RepID=UPI000BFF0204|nr:cysteine dioxygenase family protein [Mycolicibacterium palauense]
MSTSVFPVLPDSAIPPAIPTVPGPTRLRIPDLLHATDRAADEFLSGRYDHLLPEGGPPGDRRWFLRLHADDDLDLWLISWVRGYPTELHDHGGSLGALTLLSGALAEYRWDGSALRVRRLEAGDQAAFPLGWVHDVAWAPSSDPEPTLSVHAYSPPLTAMSYYEVTARSTLRRNRTELTHGGPEHR